MEWRPFPAIFRIPAGGFRSVENNPWTMIAGNRQLLVTARRNCHER
jgi:hypothetical protein